MFTDPSPKINDSDNALLFKIAQILNSSSGGGGAGVTTFNGRSGVVTLNSGDVTTALGFTPISQAAGDARWVLKTGDTMTGALAIGNGTLAVASAPYLNLSQTWNNAGVTFTGLLSNVTLTAAGSNSNLFNFQIDGVDRFNFTSGGSFRAVRQDASDSGLNLFLRKRGSVGGATNAIAANATIATVAFSGWDSAAFATGASIVSVAEGAWTGISHGTRINFNTTPTGSVLDATALTLYPNGSAGFSNGDASLPAIAFISDTNTGFYRVGADSIGISTGGALKLSIASSLITSSVDVQFDTGNLSCGNLVVQSSFQSVQISDARFSVIDNNIGVTVFVASGNSGVADFGIQFFSAASSVGQQAAPGNTLPEVLAALRAYGLLAP